MERVIAPLATAQLVAGRSVGWHPFETCDDGLAGSPQRLAAFYADVP